ncbi:MAG: CpsD/CapB family tyrosine-protein kinase [Firmicutes bacterium]|nr:CpsD/CapB family tyrosine-protein kinase [Bacillota bacterium]
MTTPERLIDSQASIALEQYRSLRTNIDFLRATRDLHVVTITSGMPEAGKSLTAANLGMAFAMSDVRTLVIDADLRRPSQHHLFELENRQGLTTALMREGDASGYIQQGPLPHLHVLTSGPLPPNPTELLANGRIERLLERLRVEAEVILMDTPPVLSFAETAILAHAADGVVYVVRAGSYSRRLDMKAMGILQRAQTTVLGSVLNDAQLPAKDSYYY